MVSRVTGTVVVLGTMTLAALGSATVAIAHSPSVEASCVAEKAKLSVGLDHYSGQKRNSVSVTDNGMQLAHGDFASEYHKKWDDLDGAVDHVFVVAVKAGDDPDQTQGWSFTRKVELPRCVTPPSTTAPTTTTTAQPSTVPEPSSALSTSVREHPPADVQGGGTPPLAATGVSTPVILLGGLGLLAAGAVAVLLARRRRA